MVIYKYYRKERFKYFVFRSGVEVDWIVWGGGRHQKVKSRVEKKGGKTQTFQVGIYVVYIRYDIIASLRSFRLIILTDNFLSLHSRLI